MTKKLLLVVCEGSETTEVVVTYDNLKYAGIDVKLAGLNSIEPVSCSCGLRITPEISLENVKDNLYDGIILPGGRVGPENLLKDINLGIFVKRHYKENRLVATICGGALVLLANEVAYGKRLTTYPQFESRLKDHYEITNSNVVVHDNLITSRGPGTVFDFSFAIIEYLLGVDVMNSVKKGCLFD